MKRPRGTADVDNSDDRPAAVAKLDDGFVYQHKLQLKVSALSLVCATSASKAVKSPQQPEHQTQQTVPSPQHGPCCMAQDSTPPSLRLLRLQPEVADPATSSAFATLPAVADTAATPAAAERHDSQDYAVRNDSESLISDDVDSPSSSSSAGYPIHHSGIDTVDLTVDTDTDDESDILIVDNVLIFRPRGQPTTYCGVLDAALCRAEPDAATLAITAYPKPADAAARPCTLLCETSGSSGGPTDSDAYRVSRIDCSDPADVQHVLPDPDSSSPGIVSKPSRGIQSGGQQSKAQQAADTPTAGQSTPPGSSAAHLQQQQQQHQQQLETPVLTEQQRIRTAADCKSPGTPQLLLLPGVIPATSIDPPPPAAAACTPHHQQHMSQHEDVVKAAAAAGRKVLSVMQVGQQRGIITFSSRGRCKPRSLQRQNQDLLQSPGRTSAVNSSSARGITAAAPGTPEMRKQTQTVVHETQSQLQQQQQQHAGMPLDTDKDQAGKVCKSLSSGVAARSKSPASLLHSAVTPAAVPACGVMLSAAAVSGQAISSVLTNQPQMLETAIPSKVITSAAESSRKARHQETQPTAAAAIVSALTAIDARAGGSGGVGVGVVCSLPAAPVSDCRTMAYVRIPRQHQVQPGLPLHGRLAAMKQTQSSAPQPYHIVSAAAYISGSNESWCSSSSSVINDSRSPSSTPSGAGTLSVRPTLEQRVQCAYLRMRLSEAAAGGADWAALDLAGLPLDTSQQAVEASRQRYVKERAVLLKYRNIGQVTTEDKKMTAAFQWIKEVRMAATAAAKSCARQGILKRPAPVSDMPAWQVSSNSVSGTTLKQRLQRVRFSIDVQMSEAAPSAAHHQPA